jgi:hypothetical protein
MDFVEGDVFDSELGNETEHPLKIAIAIETELMRSALVWPSYKRMRDQCRWSSC